MLKSGAEILISELMRNNVTKLFGYPGGSILSVYDALYGKDSIEHVLSVDERGAVFMADGYARSSGKTGVCMATSGPGATNLVTGIASAFMDSIPLVIITGNVQIDTLGHDGFQEVDTTGITMPVTKYNYIVKDINDLGYIVNEAFALAQSGRKGPVLIDIPANILDETCAYSYRKPSVKKPSSVSADEIARAAQIINESVKPLIYVGGGVVGSGTSDLAVKLAEKLNAPVGVSLMGIGGVPSSHPNFIGTGTSINLTAKEALRECDVFISLGARFSNKATEKSLYRRTTKLVHLDIDKAEIGKILTAEAGVCGDLTQSLPMLIDSVSAKSGGWLNKILKSKANNSYALTVPNCYIKCLNEHFGRGQVVTTDVGQHQLWVANYYEFDKPRRFLSSCGLGAMGYGLGAAIGAYFAAGERPLMITGDGSFNMNFNELLTVKEYNIPVVIAVMNNKTLGMIRETQSKNYKGRYIDSDLKESVDYKLLASAFGIDGYVAKTPGELEVILKELPKDKPAVIDCRVGKNEKAL